MAYTQEQLAKMLGAQKRKQFTAPVVPQVSKPVVLPKPVVKPTAINPNVKSAQDALARTKALLTTGAPAVTPSRVTSAEQVKPYTTGPNLLTGYAQMLRTIAEKGPMQVSDPMLAGAQRGVSDVFMTQKPTTPDLIYGKTYEQIQAENPKMTTAGYVGGIVAGALPSMAGGNWATSKLPAMGKGATFAAGLAADTGIDLLATAPGAISSGVTGEDYAKSAALNVGANVALAGAGALLGKAIRSIKSGAKASDVVADLAQNAPESKVSIQQELGLPEGSTWDDIQRKMEEDEAVEALYQKYETTQPKLAPEAPKKPFSGTEEYGVPEGKTYEQFAHEQEQARLAEDYLRQLEEGTSAAEAARNVYPGKPFSGTEQYGVPEGMDYATYQRKLDEERAVDEYYKQFETAQGKPQEYQYGQTISANGKKYRVIDDDGSNLITVDVETGNQQIIPKAASSEFKPVKSNKETIAMEDRDMINVGKQNVKAYQHENPEYKPFFQEMAQQTLNDLKNTLKGQKIFIGEVGEVADSVTGVTRQTSSTIENILNSARTAKNKKANALTYGQIQKGLEDIINDKGSENNAIAKRVEIFLHDALVNGYKAVDGMEIPPNAEYTATRQMLEANKAKGILTPKTLESELGVTQGFVPETPQQPKLVPSLKPQTPNASTTRIADTGIPQGIVTQAPPLPPAPRPVVPPPRIPDMPNIERELFPSTMRQPTPSPQMPEPAIITAQKRAQEALRPIAPELPKSATRANITPSVAQRMEQVEPDLAMDPKTTKTMPKVSAVLPEGQQQSKLYTNTLPKSDIFTPQELENLNIEYEGGYNPKANAETLANAKQRIASNGADVELEKLKQKDSFNSDDFVTSMEILKDKVLAEARATGDYSKVPEMLELIRKSGSTEAGRVVQAHQIYTRTPEGMITVAKKVVDNVNAKGGKAVLTPDDIQAIDKSMKKYQDLPPGREKDVELAKVKKIIADKIPPTFIDKFRGLQRISWLLNPKTLITRNPLGNLIMQGAEGLKNIPATGIDYLVGLKTGKRTTTVAGGYFKGFAKGAKDQAADIMQGVDTSPTGGQAEITRSRTFENETLNKLDQTVGSLLKLGDRPFYEGSYNSRIEQLKKLNKTQEVTSAMEEDAKLYALEKTFQKDSEIAKAFAKLKTISTNPAYQVFANTLLPFTKTPANILDKMFEYTPGGFIKAATQIGKKGDAFNQKYFVDNISRALTGTGIMALGYAGAKNGFITGKPDKDKEVASVERLIGHLPYAFVTDGGSYTFDWAQPVSALLAIGADAYYGGKDKNDFAEQLSASAEAAGNTFLNMGMLQGVTKAFSGYSPVAGLTKTAVEGTTGIANPTFFGQVARIADPTVRETNNKLLPKMQAKVPGASMLLEPKLDLFGRETKQSEGRGMLARAAENMLSPGYYATGEASTPSLKEAYRVYKATGEKDIFPRLAPATITVKGETKKLTPELKAEFQKVMGEMNLNDLERLVNSASYKNADDEKKAKMLYKVIDSNREDAKKKLMPKIKALD